MAVERRDPDRDALAIAQHDALDLDGVSVGDGSHVCDPVVFEPPLVTVIGAAPKRVSTAV
jgi:hypothetical protein